MERHADEQQGVDMKEEEKDLKCFKDFGVL